MAGAFTFTSSPPVPGEVPPGALETLAESAGSEGELEELEELEELDSKVVLALRPDVRRFLEGGFFSLEGFEDVSVARKFVGDMEVFSEDNLHLAAVAFATNSFACATVNFDRGSQRQSNK